MCLSDPLLVRACKGSPLPQQFPAGANSRKITLKAAEKIVGAVQKGQCFPEQCMQNSAIIQHASRPKALTTSAADRDLLSFPTLTSAFYSPSVRVAFQPGPITSKLQFEKTFVPRLAKLIHVSSSNSSSSILSKRIICIFRVQNEV